MRACVPEMEKRSFTVVFNECLHFLVTYAITQNAEEFFGGPVVPENAASSGAAYLQEFGDNWSKCVELEKEGKDVKIIELIRSMIHATESNVPAEKNDKQRLEKLALSIAYRLPTMQEAFIELVK
jgi:hypothetical protein